MHFGHIFPPMTGTKGLQKNIILIGCSLNPGNEGSFQKTLAGSLGLCLGEPALSIGTSGIAFLSFHSAKTSSSNSPAQKYPSDISFSLRDSSETHKRAFHSAAWTEIPFPPLHTHTLTLLYLQMTNSLCRHELRPRTSLSQHSTVLSAGAGAARDAAGNHRCVDSEGKAASCSRGCEVWDVVYKERGVDVCQEVVNKLGALFFLWLSLESLVCLWRKLPGFSDSKAGTFSGGS